jgi:hypothetical protein
MSGTGGGVFQQLATQLNLIAQNLGRLVAQTSLAVNVPISQGGTGATTASGARDNLGIVVGGVTPNHLAAFATPNSFQDGGFGGIYQVGELLAANFNITGDQTITVTLPPGAVVWALDAVMVTNPTVPLSAAVGGIYLGPGKTGVQVVAATQHYSGLASGAPNTAGSLLFLTCEQSVALTVAALFFSLTTPQGVAATADLRVYARPLF